ncbi:Uncharacterised protein [uncultured archaeon]|nr:Uncharacterised protein [uncultured archaeon]
MHGKTKKPRVPRTILSLAFEAFEDFPACLEIMPCGKLFNLRLKKPRVQRTDFGIQGSQKLETKYLDSLPSKWFIRRNERIFSHSLNALGEKAWNVSSMTSNRSYNAMGWKTT